MAETGESLKASPHDGERRVGRREEEERKKRSRRSRTRSLVEDTPSLTKASRVNLPQVPSVLSGHGQLHVSIWLV